MEKFMSEVLPGEKKVVDHRNVNALLRFLQDQRQEIEQGSISEGSLASLVALCLGCLEMEPIFTFQPSNLYNSIVPIHMTIVRTAGSLDLRKDSLDLLNVIIQKACPNEIFSLWSVFLPGSSGSPYQISVCELIDKVREASLQQLVLQIMSIFFNKVGPHFAYIEKKSSSTMSFTPIYQSLAEALEKTHFFFVSFLRDGQTNQNQIIMATKTLGQLLKRCPYKKLKPEVIKSVRDLAIDLCLNTNPASQIAGLNLFLAVCNADSEMKSEMARECCKIYVDLAFSFNPRLLDNNVRYVALQNLGTMTSSHMDSIVGHLDDLCLSMENLFCIKARDNVDNVVLLHAMRLFKLLAKSENNLGGTKILKLWLHLVKPKNFQWIENCNDSSLQAGLCDFLAELGEEAFSEFPSDKKMLCVTYILTHCSESNEVAVRASAFRGLGTAVAFKSLQTDTSFLIDCTEKVITELEKVNNHKSILMSVHWTVANLSETLLDIHLDNAELGSEFPKHLILKLLSLQSAAANFSKSHTSIQFNILRSAGCLLHCIDQSYILDSDTEQALYEYVEKTVKLIVTNVRENAITKVRWNACCAAGKFLQNSHLNKRNWHKIVVDSLVEAVEECPNFKVKINAAIALTSVTKHSVERGRLEGIFFTLMNEIERTENDDSHAEEIAHKTDLINALCQTICHLICVCDSNDLFSIENNISRDLIDNMRFSFAQVQKRLPPEKSKVFLKASERLSSDHSQALFQLLNCSKLV